MELVDRVSDAEDASEAEELFDLHVEDTLGVSTIRIDSATQSQEVERVDHEELSAASTNAEIAAAALTVGSMAVEEDAHQIAARMFTEAERFVEESQRLVLFDQMADL